MMSLASNKSFEISTRALVTLSGRITSRSMTALDRILCTAAGSMETMKTLEDSLLTLIGNTELSYECSGLVDLGSPVPALDHASRVSFGMRTSRCATVDLFRPATFGRLPTWIPVREST